MILVVYQELDVVHVLIPRSDHDQEHEDDDDGDADSEKGQEQYCLGENFHIRCQVHILMIIVGIMQEKRKSVGVVTDVEDRTVDGHLRQVDVDKIKSKSKDRNKTHVDADDSWSKSVQTEN